MWIDLGKLGFPDRAIVAIALGADMINIAREAMHSIGRIQAQKCHTEFCPAGVATQSSLRKKELKLIFNQCIFKNVAKVCEKKFSQ